MATLTQVNTATGDGVSSIVLAFAGAVAAGDLIVAACNQQGTALLQITSIADSVNAGNYAQDTSLIYNGDTGYGSVIFSKANSAAGTPTVTLTANTATYYTLTIYDIVGLATASPLDVANTASFAVTNPISLTLVTTVNNDCIVAVSNNYNNWSYTAGANYTIGAQGTWIVNSTRYGSEYDLDAGVAGSISVDATLVTSGGAGPYSTLAAAAYKALAASDVLFAQALM